MTKYVLIKWKDGYREVASLDDDTKGILRYYVIERIERYGRLAIDSEAEYPGLKIIKRKPDQIESITLTENGHGTVFVLDPKEDKSEGGRTDHYYEVKGTREDVIEELISDLKQTIKELGIEPTSTKEEDLERIRKKMKISCFERQNEVLSFLKMLLEKCV